ncbi:MAG: mechanosensitive ion channel family protein [Elusimicrobiota bacterium]|jgi:small-conductance mechanosensitive channel|nr:mechanosensitive ion channel family protein [Elusimicrobiota bacterium]
MNFLTKLTTAFNNIIFSNSASGHLKTILVFLISFILALSLRKIINFIVKRSSIKISDGLILDIVINVKKLTPILFYMPFYLICRISPLPNFIEKFITASGIVFIIVCSVLYITSIVHSVSSKYFSNLSNELLKNSFDIFSDIIIWTMAVLLILSNLGFNINTLLAGLGIGGMAIALASQSILGNLFNYFTILLDKPFVLGDDISIDGNIGKIKRIGLKGTRMVGIDGEEIIISNTDITKGVLKNYKNMQKRRKLVILGVRYDTSPELIKEIPSILKNIVLSVPQTEFARVHFSSFSASSLDFELVFFVLSNNFRIYMDRAQEVNFKILDEFSKRGIGFAFPTNSIYIEH